MPRPRSMSDKDIINELKRRSPDGVTAPYWGDLESTFQAQIRNFMRKYSHACKLAGLEMPVKWRSPHQKRMDNGIKPVDRGYRFKLFCYTLHLASAVEGRTDLTAIASCMDSVAYGKLDDIEIINKSKNKGGAERVG